jgi:D-alanine-D-alanine ligase-like ATP-grasp enzyme
VLVERYLPGSAFACIVLGNGADRVVLPPVSLASGSNPGDPPSVDHVPEGLREGVERVVLETCKALDLRDLARVDIALSERGVPHVISADPLPDLTGDLSNPVLLAADSTGLDQMEVIQRTLHVAAGRSGVPLPQSPAFDDLRYRTPPRGLRLRSRHA